MNNNKNINVVLDNDCCSCQSDYNSHTYQNKILPENYFRISLSPKMAGDSSKTFMIEVGISRLMEFVETASKDYDIRILS